MAFLSLQPSGNQMYIYIVQSYRNEQKKPTNSRISIGKISPNTFLPEYKAEFLADLQSGKSIITKDQFDEFNKKDFKSELIAKNIKINNDNNIVSNNNVIRNITLNDQNKIILNNEIFDSLSDWGTPYFFNQISQNIGLNDILKSVFGDYMAEIITILAIYLIVSKKAMMYCQNWLNHIDTTIVKSLSSQRISEILLNISYSQRLNFYNKWFEKVKENEFVALDITSLSTYSKNIKKAALGYNRDDEKLPQINLCMLFGQTYELPIYQTIFNGSLNDVSTLFSTLSEFIAVNNNTKYILTMNKGFFSEPNIDILLNKNVGNGFLIGVPFTNNLAKSLPEKYGDLHKNQKHLVSSAENKLYGITENIIFGTKKHNLFAHIYYNPDKYFSERQQLIFDLTKLQQLLVEGKKLTKNNKSQILKYFDITNINGHISPTINSLMFEESLKFAGWHILFSNTINNYDEANKIYQHKDVIEKSFNSLKNRLLLHRIRVHNSERMENKLFILFIALILISDIHNKLRKNGLYNSYTMDKVFEIIELLKKTKINSNIVYKPLTKEVKSIFKACDIHIPSFDKVI
jgi:transposase